MAFIDFQTKRHESRKDFSTALLNSWKHEEHANKHFLEEDVNATAKTAIKTEDGAKEPTKVFFHCAGRKNPRYPCPGQIIGTRASDGKWILETVVPHTIPPLKRNTWQTVQAIATSSEEEEEGELDHPKRSSSYIRLDDRGRAPTSGYRIIDHGADRFPPAHYTSDYAPGSSRGRRERVYHEWPDESWVRDPPRHLRRRHRSRASRRSPSTSYSSSISSSESEESDRPYRRSRHRRRRSRSRSRSPREYYPRDRDQRHETTRQPGRQPHSTDRHTRDAYWPNIPTRFNRDTRLAPPSTFIPPGAFRAPGPYHRRPPPAAPAAARQSNGDPLTAALSRPPVLPSFSTMASRNRPSGVGTVGSDSKNLAGRPVAASITVEQAVLNAQAVDPTAGDLPKRGNLFASKELFEAACDKGIPPFSEWGLKNTRNNSTSIEKTCSHTGIHRVCLGLHFRVRAQRNARGEWAVDRATYVHDTGKSVDQPMRERPRPNYNQRQITVPIASPAAFEPSQPSPPRSPKRVLPTKSQPSQPSSSKISPSKSDVLYVKPYIPKVPAKRVADDEVSEESVYLPTSESEDDLSLTISAPTTAIKSVFSKTTTQTQSKPVSVAKTKQDKSSSSTATKGKVTESVKRQEGLKPNAKLATNRKTALATSKTKQKAVTPAEEEEDDSEAYMAGQNIDWMPRNIIKKRKLTRQALSALEKGPPLLFFPPSTIGSPELSLNTTKGPDKTSALIFTKPAGTRTFLDDASSSSHASNIELVERVVPRESLKISAAGLRLIGQNIRPIGNKISTHQCDATGTDHSTSSTASKSAARTVQSQSDSSTSNIAKSAHLGFLDAVSIDEATSPSSVNAPILVKVESSLPRYELASTRVETPTPSPMATDKAFEQNEISTILELEMFAFLREIDSLMTPEMASILVQKGLSPTYIKRFSASKWRQFSQSVLLKDMAPALHFVVESVGKYLENLDSSE